MSNKIVKSLLALIMSLSFLALSGTASAWYTNNGWYNNHYRGNHYRVYRTGYGYGYGHCAYVGGHRNGWGRWVPAHRVCR